MTNNAFKRYLSLLEEFRGHRDIAELRDVFLSLFVLNFLSDSKSPLPRDSLNVRALLASGERDLHVRLNTVLADLENQVPALKGLFDAVYDFAAQHADGNPTDKDLYYLLKGIYNVALDDRSEDYADIYTDLIAHFAENSNRTAPNFYSPDEVTQLVAALLNPQAGMSVYDPVCGSGGFLLAAAKHSQSRDSHQHCTLFGQYPDFTAWRIAKQNMLVHGLNDADIKVGNVLTAPGNVNGAGQLQTFDLVMTNPPFSLGNWTQTDDDPFYRFNYGQPPLGNADYAFIQHILASLKHGGYGAVIVPDGVLFRAATEQKIRRAIIEAHNVDAVISLPSNVFHGTAIPTNVLILRKRSASNEVFFIDARGPLNTKVKRQKSIEKSVLANITDAYRKKIDIDGFSRKASLSEIADNDFDLTVSRYVTMTSSDDGVPLYLLVEKQAMLESKLQQLQAEMKLLTNLAERK